MLEHPVTRDIFKHVTAGAHFWPRLGSAEGMVTSLTVFRRQQIHSLVMRLTQRHLFSICSYHGKMQTQQANMVVVKAMKRPQPPVRLAELLTTSGNSFSGVVDCTICNASGFLQ